MNKSGKIISAAVYGIGVIITIVLLILFFSRSAYVPFPDAMLPETLSELASGYLAWGAVLMLIATVIFYRQFHISQSRHKFRNTVIAFLPAIICMCFLLYWIFAWVIGIFNFFL